MEARHKDTNFSATKAAKVPFNNASSPALRFLICGFNDQPSPLKGGPCIHHIGEFVYVGGRCSIVGGGFSRHTVSRLWCEKQVSGASISNCIPQFPMGCNYLHMPQILAYDTKVPLSFYRWRCKRVGANRYIVGLYVQHGNIVKPFSTFVLLFVESNTRRHNIPQVLPHHCPLDITMTS